MFSEDSTSAAMGRTNMLWDPSLIVHLKPIANHHVIRCVLSPIGESEVCTVGSHDLASAEVHPKVEEFLPNKGPSVRY